MRLLIKLGKSISCIDNVKLTLLLAEKETEMKNSSDKKGKWIYKHWCYFECSECKHGVDKYKKENLTPYCPMCGAEMEQ